MKPFIDTQLNHKSIRVFKNELLSDETIALLEDVAIRTATSLGMQQASIIKITDPILKEKIADICQQDYVAKAPHLWIFIVDTYRNGQIAQSDKHAGEFYRFLQGYSDTHLMAQNVVNSIESLGYGAVFLGSIQNNFKALSKLLNLPKHTAPAIGLGFGIPNQMPQLKPRLPKSLRIFENSYQLPENTKQLLEEYDNEMMTYYDLRQVNKRSDSFSSQVKQQMNRDNEKHLQIIPDLEEKGFKF